MKRFRMKRNHVIDTKPVLTDGTETPEAKWNNREEKRRKKYMGHQPKKVEYDADPDSMKAKQLSEKLNDHCLPNNTNHTKNEFLWTKQEETKSMEDHWNKVVKLEEK